MKIIRATLEQLEDTHALLNEYFEAINVVVRDTPDGVKAFLSAPDSALWLAYVDGAPAGCVALRPLPLPQVGGAVECKRLYVRPQHRGLGIAEALLDAMEAHAAAEGRSWIYLDSKAGLDAAIRLYRKRGYQDCERYNDNPEATVFQRKALQ
ncbi:GNAT family N-acetyltransferase [Pseudoduganella rhizocola]|uniref:GNAT family N-acetyltransferase n=1 Tax=Pseudoduganella rhizocola TaxID=3382643 RepID=UPI0038B63E10